MDKTARDLLTRSHFSRLLFTTANNQSDCENLSCYGKMLNHCWILRHATSQEHLANKAQF